MMADVAGGTLNSSAANFNTAVKGVFSGTDNTLKGNLGSEVSVILNVTLEAEGAAMTDNQGWDAVLTLIGSRLRDPRS